MGFDEVSKSAKIGEINRYATSFWDLVPFVIVVREGCGMVGGSKSDMYLITNCHGILVTSGGLRDFLGSD